MRNPDRTHTMTTWARQEPRPCEQRKRVVMPADEDSQTIFAIRGPIARPDFPGLSERVCEILASSAATVALCDIRGVASDAVTVDALARLQLAAGRHGCQVRLRGASAELRELVAFMGLGDVLPD